MCIVVYLFFYIISTNYDSSENTILESLTIFNKIYFLLKKRVGYKEYQILQFFLYL